MLKICNYIYIVRFLTSSCIQSSKNKHHQLTFKSKWTSFYMRTCLDACRKYTVSFSYADSNVYIKKVIQI